MYEYASCVAITIICYAVAYTIKKAELMKEKYIPLGLVVIGAILGIFAFISKMPSYPANDIISAIAVGIYSSLMAVGVNQVFKQTGKDE